MKVGVAKEVEHPDGGEEEMAQCSRRRLPARTATGIFRADQTWELYPEGPSSGVPPDDFFSRKRANPHMNWGDGGTGKNWWVPPRRIYMPGLGASMSAVPAQIRRGKVSVLYSGRRRRSTSKTRIRMGAGISPGAAKRQGSPRRHSVLRPARSGGWEKTSPGPAVA